MANDTGADMEEEGLRNQHPDRYQPVLYAHPGYHAGSRDMTEGPAQSMTGEPYVMYLKVEDIQAIGAIVADRLTDRLSENVISGSYPAEIARHYLSAGHGQQVRWRWTIPVGNQALMVETVFTSTGAIIIELQDTTGCKFWEGALTPGPMD